MYEPTDSIFAQVGDCCYLARYLLTEENGDIIVTDVHWIARKGDTVKAESEFHATLGTSAAGCEVIYRGPAQACVPHGSFHGVWPYGLPMSDVGQ